MHRSQDGGFIGTPKRLDMRGSFEPRYSSSNVIFLNAFRFRNVAIYRYGKIEIDAGIVNADRVKNTLRYNIRTIHKASVQAK